MSIIQPDGGDAEVERDKITAEVRDILAAMSADQIRAFIVATFRTIGTPTKVVAAALNCSPRSLRRYAHRASVPDLREVFERQ